MTAFPNGTMLRRVFHMRPLIAVAVAYALVVQVFAAALGPPLGIGLDPQIAVELCAHDALGAPVAPADLPERPCLQHCIFCFANSTLALAALEAATIQAAELKVGQSSWRADRARVPQPPRYAIARPRGPPPSA